MGEITNQELLDEEDLLNLLNPKTFDIRNFSDQFLDKSDEVLSKVLNLQKDAPLKKGGSSIAYRSDIILMKNKQQWGNAANTLFDLLAGVVSSNPQDKTFVLSISDIQEALPSVNSIYIYEMVETGFKELKQKSNFIFETESTKGKTNKRTEVLVPWQDLLVYDRTSNNGKSETLSLAFRPSNFCKLLMCSSSLVHGAHYQADVAAQLGRSPQVRQLFYLLSSKKRFKETPVAPEGVFRMEFSTLKDLCGALPTTTYGIFNRDVLQKAKAALNKVENSDFTFDYKEEKHKTPTSQRAVVTHIIFTIHIKEALPYKNVVVEEIEDKNENVDLENSDVLKVMLKEIGIVDNNEQNQVLKKYKTFNRTIVDMVDGISKINNSNNIKNKAGFLSWFLENKGQIKEQKNDKNSLEMSAYEDINFDEFEKDILSN